MYETAVCPLFHVKVVFLNKAVQLTTWRVVSAFPGDNLCTWVSCRSAFCILPISSHRIFKRPIHWFRFIKSIIFIVSSRTFLSEIYFLKSPVHGGERHVTLVQFDAITWIYAKASAVLPVIDFVPPVQVLTQWKRQTIS